MLVLPHQLNPTAGGVQRSTWQLGHGLAERGVNVCYAAISTDGHTEPHHGTLRHPRTRTECQGAERQVWLRNTIRDFEPDVVINQFGFSSELSKTIWNERRETPYGVISCYHNNPRWFAENLEYSVRQRLRAHPLLATAAASPLALPFSYLYHRVKTGWLFREAVHRCDRFMLLSPTFVNELQWYVPSLDSSKVFIAPNAFETPQEVGLERPKRLLFVARLEHAQKQVLLLPALWQQLHARLSDWELVIVGEGEDGNQLRQMMTDAGLPRWRMVGRQIPDDYYNSSRIFLMLSRYEGFGNTLVEAQLRGCVPILFNSYSAAEWMMNDGVDSILVKPFDLAEYAEQVVQLAEDEPRRRRMAEAALQNAERFTSEAIMPLWMDAIEMVRPKKRNT
jgi:glycosyltransferase involved in cell wall biosynthesis